MARSKKKAEVKVNNKLHVKKGDKVVVIAGRDKGKTGEVLRTYPQRNRVVVAGVQKIKRHTRPSALSAGGVIEKEASIHVSNVMLVDPKENKGTRVGKKILDDGTKVRVAKKSGEVIDN